MTRLSYSPNFDLENFDSRLNGGAQPKVTPPAWYTPSMEKVNSVSVSPYVKYFESVQRRRLECESKILTANTNSQTVPNLYDWSAASSRRPTIEPASPMSDLSLNTNESEMSKRIEEVKSKFARYLMDDTESMWMRLVLKEWYVTSRESKMDRHAATIANESKQRLLMQMFVSDSRSAVASTFSAWRAVVAETKGREREVGLKQSAAFVFAGRTDGMLKSASFQVWRRSVASGRVEAVQSRLMESNRRLESALNQVDRMGDAAIIFSLGARQYSLISDTFYAWLVCAFREKKTVLLAKVNEMAKRQAPSDVNFAAQMNLTAQNPLALPSNLPGVPRLSLTHGMPGMTGVNMQQAPSVTFAVQPGLPPVPMGLPVMNSSAASNMLNATGLNTSSAMVPDALPDLSSSYPTEMPKREGRALLPGTGLPKPNFSAGDTLDRHASHASRAHSHKGHKRDTRRRGSSSSSDSRSDSGSDSYSSDSDSQSKSGSDSQSKSDSGSQADPAEPGRPSFNKRASHTASDSTRRASVSFGAAEVVGPGIPPAALSTASALSPAAAPGQPKKKLPYFLPIRFVKLLKNKAAAARAVVKERHLQESENKASANRVWKPNGSVPADLQMTNQDAIRIAKTGMMLEKNVGSNEKRVSSMFACFANPKRFFVVNVDNPDRFLEYSSGSDSQTVKGWYTLVEMQGAKYDYRSRTIRVYVVSVHKNSQFDVSQSSPAAGAGGKNSVVVPAPATSRSTRERVISSIPERFFKAIVICVRLASMRFPRPA